MASATRRGRAPEAPAHLRALHELVVPVDQDLPVRDPLRTVQVSLRPHREPRHLESAVPRGSHPAVRRRLRRATTGVERSDRPPTLPDRPLHGPPRRPRGGEVRARAGAAGLGSRRWAQHRWTRRLGRRAHDRLFADEGDPRRPRRRDRAGAAGCRLGRLRSRDPGLRPREPRRPPEHYRHRGVHAGGWLRLVEPYVWPRLRQPRRGGCRPRAAAGRG